MIVDVKNIFWDPNLNWNPGIWMAEVPRLASPSIYQADPRYYPATGQINGPVTEILGGNFNDYLVGRAGNQSIHGEAGNDTLDGGAGADHLDGGAGINTVSYARSNEGVTVNLSTGYAAGGHAKGDEVYYLQNIRGSLYNDKLTGDLGSNLLAGEAGNDWLVGSGGYDTLAGGEGQDTAVYSWIYGGVAVFLNSQITYKAGWAVVDKLENIEGAVGSESMDYLGGDYKNNMLYGSGGDDVVEGFKGNDLLEGGKGDDNLAGGGGQDIVDGGNGHDYLYGDAGDDLLIGGKGWDHLTGGAGVDTFAIVDLSAQVDIFRDFKVGVGGDKLAVGDLLSQTSYNDAAPLANFLRIIDLRGNSMLQVNADGHGNDWQSIATFYNVHNLTLQTLYDNGELIF